MKERRVQVHVNVQDAELDDDNATFVLYSALIGSGGQHRVWLRRTSPSQHAHCSYTHVAQSSSHCSPAKAAQRQVQAMQPCS